MTPELRYRLERQEADMYDLRVELREAEVRTLDARLRLARLEGMLLLRPVPCGIEPSGGPLLTLLPPSSRLDELFGRLPRFVQTIAAVLIILATMLALHWVEHWSAAVQP